MFVHITVFITVEHIVQLRGRVRVSLHPLWNFFQLYLHCLVKSTVVLSVGVACTPCTLIFLVPFFLKTLKFVEGDRRGAARSLNAKSLDQPISIFWFIAVLAAAFVERPLVNHGFLSQLPLRDDFEHSWNWERILAHKVQKVSYLNR